MVDALRAAEDEHFFEHAGFDPFASSAPSSWTLRIANAGASTLTQQLRHAGAENVPRAGAKDT